MSPRHPLGATPLPGGSCRFVVWAPKHAQVDVVLAREERTVRLERDQLGYHRGVLSDVPPGSRYRYRLANDPKHAWPDPVSRLQPEGVHEASQVVDPTFSWTDQAWKGLALADYVIYELHVGTFTGEGTFDAIHPHLDRLREMGVTAIELMPVAQFPGTRNWGYDGVYPYAVQHSYGGPKGLKGLVNACHERGLALILDVVYNHLGPEGNYLDHYGPYFTAAYLTPWGKAINFDGPGCDQVRRYFCDNALEWVRDYHIDALRLDAVHAICDRSAHPFLQQLAEEVHGLGEQLARKVVLFAESDLNDPKLIQNSAVGGYGLDAMWCDDLHHATHVLLTDERDGYYRDFGQVEHLARAWEHGMAYTGDYSLYRERRHGRPIPNHDPSRIVVNIQTHDQVGNRMLGERLGALIDFESEKLAAGIVTLSPYLPLLFMGQEYGETAPFQYFVSHSDPALVNAVRQGRREEFKSFTWQGELPDPQSETTFDKSTLDHELYKKDRHAVLVDFYQRLFAIRLELPAETKDDTVAFERSKVLLVRRDTRAWMVFHFGQEPAAMCLPVPNGSWKRAIASADPKWHGPGCELPEMIESNGEVHLILSPRAFCVYTAARLPYGSSDE